jgi:hypothetical protein
MAISSSRQAGEPERWADKEVFIMGYRKALFLLICVFGLFSCYPSNQYNNTRVNNLAPIDTLKVTTVYTEKKSQLLVNQLLK